MLSGFGIRIDMARSTDEGLLLLRKANYDVVVTDMTRDDEKANPKASCHADVGEKLAGCYFLKEIARLPNPPPAIVYASNTRSEWGTPAYANGITNRPDYLVNYIFDALERRPEQNSLSLAGD